jgi:hypothetical protein
VLKGCAAERVRTDHPNVSLANAPETSMNSARVFIPSVRVVCPGHDPRRRALGVNPEWSAHSTPFTILMSLRARKLCTIQPPNDSPSRSSRMWAQSPYGRDLVQDIDVGDGRSMLQDCSHVIPLKCCFVSASQAEPPFSVILVRIFFLSYLYTIRGIKGILILQYYR